MKIELHENLNHHAYFWDPKKWDTLELLQYIAEQNDLYPTTFDMEECVEIQYRRVQAALAERMIDGSIVALMSDYISLLKKQNAVVSALKVLTDATSDKSGKYW